MDKETFFCARLRKNVRCACKTGKKLHGCMDGCCRLAARSRKTNRGGRLSISPKLDLGQRLLAGPEKSEPPRPEVQMQRELERESEIPEVEPEEKELPRWEGLVSLSPGGIPWGKDVDIQYTVPEGHEVLVPEAELEVSTSGDQAWMSHTVVLETEGHVSGMPGYELLEGPGHELAGWAGDGFAGRPGLGLAGDAGMIGVDGVHGMGAVFGRLEGYACFRGEWVQPSGEVGDYLHPDPFFDPMEPWKYIDGGY